jgi:hypothetical protein
MAAYEIIERDEAGIETGRYVSSGKGSRVDVIVRRHVWSLFQVC